MSITRVSIIGGVTLALGFMAGSMQGCGSSGGAGDAQALCNQGCDKLVSCMPDAGVTAAQCKGFCTPSGTGSGTTCSNESAIVSAYKACLAMDCAGYLTCLESIPPCQSTTGSAGTNGGGGGSTGAAGSTGAGGSGAASCDACAKADSCIMAVTAQAGGYAAACNAADASTRSMLISICQMTVQTVATQPNAPAACL